MNNKNNFSYWFPKIKDCGIKVPESMIFHVPEEMNRYFYMDDQDNDYNKIEEWVKANIIPHMNKYIYFMKNAVFSNKFDFSHCITNPHTIVDDIVNINYAALCVGAEGSDEIILREVIRYDRQKTPTIYNGMPLRSEFRTFYDFDKSKVLYSSNYWDYDYCISGMREMTDKIIFNYMKDTIKNNFESHINEVEQIITEHMKNVDLEGQWSVDTLLDESGHLWLTDMAIAQNSSYWDESKIKN